MPSKGEYEKVFNKVLGVDVRWSKLSKEELSALAVVFNNPIMLLERLGVKDYFESKSREQHLVETGVSFLRTILETWEGPIVRMLRGTLKKEEEAR